MLGYLHSCVDSHVWAAIGCKAQLLSLAEQRFRHSCMCIRISSVYFQVELSGVSGVADFTCRQTCIGQFCIPCRCLLLKVITADGKHHVSDMT